VAGAGSGHVRRPLASTGWQTDHKCQQRHQLMVHLNEMTSSHAMQSMQVYEVRPRKDLRGVDLISGALLFGRL
jgi:hypothetical protein